MARNIMIQFYWVVGTIIGILIFGEAYEYIKTFLILNIGYWTCYFYWRVGKKQPAIKK